MSPRDSHPVGQIRRTARLGEVDGVGVQRRAFTLIELMVVIVIGAMIMAIGIPNLLSKVRKDPLNQGISDICDAFRDARGRAVLSGAAMQVVIEAGDGSIRVESAPIRGESRAMNVLEKVRDRQEEEAGTKRSAFSAHLHEEVAFSALIVNTRNRMTTGDRAVAIRFFPNGTCDQFEGVVTWPKRGSRKVTLEVTTGLPEVVDIR